MISVTLNVIATTEQINEFIQEWPGKRLPIIERGDDFDGQQTTNLVCFDPDWGYWAENLGSALRERFARVSQCLYCDHEWLELPGEDANVCPGCGADLT